MQLRFTHIGQLATCPPDHPQADAGLIENAELVVRDGLVAWSGPAREMPEQYASLEAIDCAGQLVVPGLVDCHTHLCFGGWRGDEFEMRLQGHSYQDIAAAGGGIRHTVEHTRSAPTQALEEKARLALDGMLALGVTTVEAKSGYGLTARDERRQLEVYAHLHATHVVDVIPTFLGAHIVPEEFADRRDDWVSLICDELLPELASEGLARFCDAFVEQGAYTVAEGRRILERARELGLGLKLHADQLSDGGGAALAAELGAVSAEHLEYANAEGMAAMATAGTVAVSLPLASLYLRERYLPARDFLEAGVPVAVATDFNPGSAPSYHLPLAMTLACLNQQMTPQEVLMGATAVAARAIGMNGQVGSLVAGARADLALMDTPSLNQWLYHFRDNACRRVWKNGWEVTP